MTPINYCNNVRCALVDDAANCEKFTGNLITEGLQQV